MNFDKNYGNTKSFVKPISKSLRKPIRVNSAYGSSVNYRSDYTNSRGNYGFRLREHMEDVENVETEIETSGTEFEQTNSRETDADTVVEIPPELQEPENVRQKNYDDSETRQETGDYLDYMKQTSESAVEKMRKFLGF